MSITAKSNTLTAIYDADDMVLSVVFNYDKSTEYRYLNVSEEHGKAIKTEKSLGKYVNLVIKPVYAFEKVMLDS